MEVTGERKGWELLAVIDQQGHPDGVQPLECKLIQIQPPNVLPGPGFHLALGKKPKEAKDKETFSFWTEIP